MTLVGGRSDGSWQQGSTNFFLSASGNFLNRNCPWKCVSSTMGWLATKHRKPVALIQIRVFKPWKHHLSPYILKMLFCVCHKQSLTASNTWDLSLSASSASAASDFLEPWPDRSTTLRPGRCRECSRERCNSEMKIRTDRNLGYGLFLLISQGCANVCFDVVLLSVSPSMSMSMSFLYSTRPHVLGCLLGRHMSPAMGRTFLCATSKT